MTHLHDESGQSRAQRNHSRARRRGAYRSPRRPVVVAALSLIAVVAGGLAANKVASAPSSDARSVTETSLWSADVRPAQPADSDTRSVELGTSFRTSQAGAVTGIRFYKHPENTGRHTGRLWDDRGRLLTSVTFDNEAASGWQAARLASPVALQPGRWYVVSYHAPAGRYAAAPNYFRNRMLTSGVLQARAGVYAYGSEARYPTRMAECLVLRGRALRARHGADDHTHHAGGDDGVADHPAARLRQHSRRIRRAGPRRRGPPCPGPSSVVARASASRLIRCASCRSRPVARVVVLVTNAVIRCPSTSVTRSWAPGCGRSLRTSSRIPAGQRGRSNSPVISATHAPWRSSTVGVVGRRPRLRRDRGQLGLDRGGVTGKAEPDRVGQPAAGQPGDQLVRAAGPSTRTSTFLPRLLPSGNWASAARMTVMWSVTVFDPAFPLRNRNASGSPVPSGAVIEESRQRMVSEAALERRRGGLLLRMRGDQGGVYVDDQRRGGVRGVVGRVLCGQLPHPLPDRGPGGVDRLEGSLSVGGQRVDRARTRSGRRRPAHRYRVRRVTARCRPGSPRPTPGQAPDRARPCPDRGLPAAYATAPTPPTAPRPASGREVSGSSTPPA